MNKTSQKMIAKEDWLEILTDSIL
jgi:hypothetical protein